MSTIGTFDGFTAARLGIYAAQQGLQVTGNNISNINTSGYTRQRLDQVSLKTGGADMYRSMMDNHIGNGALVTSINQIRDPYLDIRYRNTASDVGYSDTMLSGLKGIASILDEVAKGDNKDGLLYAQIKDLADCLSRLGSDPCKDNDILARKSAEALCSLFNTYAGKLETLYQNTKTGFNQDITSVNKILTSIRDLNESIRNAEICGDNALELRDERNRQIDALSEYMQIKVEYTMEDVGAGKQVEKLTISLGNANPDSKVHTDETVLIDGVYGAQLSMPEKKPMPNPNATDDGFLYLKRVRDANGNDILDIDGNPVYEGTNKLSEAEQIDNDNYTLVVSRLYDAKHHQPKDPTINEGHPVALDDNDLYGSLQATRELLTEKGEFATAADVALDENAATKRGILYYRKSLDLLAQKFAEQYNKLNQGYIFNQNGDYVDADGNVLTLAGTDGVEAPVNVKSGLTELQKQNLIANGFIQKDIHGNPVLDKDGNQIADINSWLEGHGGVLAEGSGTLFSNRNDGDKTGDPADPTNPMINASNISVSHSWSTGDVKIVPTCEVLFSEDGTPTPNTTQVENVNHMISMIEKSLVYDPKELDPDAVGSKLFEGCFNDMFSNMSTVQGNDQRTTNIQLNNSYTTLTDVDTNRMGVSGVDLNDEAMNMITFQKAYSAACRLMTVIDSVLDRLINNTGITV
ncbi:MAG: flagellar basal body protein [Oscillospiraceae bacterium]|nr:flagellar basal body protein [Oscillospiraceae bacterium]MDE7172529.1 flagellar basal body protein [Oscillospiraceae bacterium]